MAPGEERWKSSERRKTPRYPAVVATGSVGWWQDASFVTTPSQIENISTGGARLNVADPVPPSDSVWIGLVGGDSSEWVEGRVVEASEDASPTPWIRVEFLDLCPYEFFATVVCGLRSEACANRIPVAVAKATTGAAGPGRNQAAQLDDPQSDRFATDERDGAKPRPNPRRSPLEKIEGTQSKSEKDRRELIQMACYVVNATLVIGLVILINQKMGDKRMIEILLRLILDK